MTLKGPRGVGLLQGELLTLEAAGAHVANGNGAAVEVSGERLVYAILLNITPSATAAGDTLDVYIDTTFDNATWVNIVHFTQQAGNGAAAREVAVIVPGNAVAATTTVVTADAAVSTIRPGYIGRYLRARWVAVDGGGGDTSHTFSVEAYAI